MVKTKTLQGLAHDTLDHAIGPFGWLHPHVGEYAEDAQLETIAIDLIATPPIETPKVPTPLKLASAALQEWFKEHLEAYGFTIRDISGARIVFGAFGSDPYVFGATAIIETTIGRKFEYRRGWPPNSS